MAFVLLLRQNSYLRHVVNSIRSKLKIVALGSINFIQISQLIQK